MALIETEETREKISFFYSSYQSRRNEDFDMSLHDLLQYRYNGAIPKQSFESFIAKIEAGLTALSFNKEGFLRVAVDPAYARRYPYERIDFLYGLYLKYNDKIDILPDGRVSVALNSHNIYLHHDKIDEDLTAENPGQAISMQDALAHVQFAMLYDSNLPANRGNVMDVVSGNVLSQARIARAIELINRHLAPENRIIGGKQAEAPFNRFLVSRGESERTYHEMTAHLNQVIVNIREYAKSDQSLIPPQHRRYADLQKAVEIGHNSLWKNNQTSAIVSDVLQNNATNSGPLTAPDKDKEIMDDTKNKDDLAKAALAALIQNGGVKTSPLIFQGQGQVDDIIEPITATIDRSAYLEPEEQLLDGSLTWNDNPQAPQYAEYAGASSVSEYELPPVKLENAPSGDLFADAQVSVAYLDKMVEQDKLEVARIQEEAELAAMEAEIQASIAETNAFVRSEQKKQQEALAQFDAEQAARPYLEARSWLVTYAETFRKTKPENLLATLHQLQESTAPGTPKTDISNFDLLVRLQNDGLIQILKSGNVKISTFNPRNDEIYVKLAQSLTNSPQDWVGKTKSDVDEYLRASLAASGKEMTKAEFSLYARDTWRHLNDDGVVFSDKKTIELIGTGLKDFGALKLKDAFSAAAANVTPREITMDQVRSFIAAPGMAAALQGVAADKLVHKLNEIATRLDPSHPGYNLDQAELLQTLQQEGIIHTKDYLKGPKGVDGKPTPVAYISHVANFNDHGGVYKDVVRQMVNNPAKWSDKSYEDVKTFIKSTPEGASYTGRDMQGVWNALRRDGIISTEKNENGKLRINSIATGLREIERHDLKREPDNKAEAQKARLNPEVAERVKKVLNGARDRRQDAEEESVPVRDVKTEAAALARNIDSDARTAIEQGRVTKKPAQIEGDKLQADFGKIINNLEKLADGKEPKFDDQPQPHLARSFAVPSVSVGGYGDDVAARQAVEGIRPSSIYAQAQDDPVPEFLTVPDEDIEAKKAIVTRQPSAIEKLMGGVSRLFGRVAEADKNFKPIAFSLKPTQGHQPGQGL